MPRNSEASFLLGVDDIIDWPRLVDKLRQAGLNGLPGPGRRIMTLLSPEVREMFSVAGQTNDLDETKKGIVVAALNEVLKRRDFYKSDDFEKLAIKDENKGRLNGDLNSLSDEEIENLNRLLLEASYPEEIRPVEPYVGPRSFQRDQRGFFFGRDEEAIELVSLITAHSAVLLYSQSGAGKTSLLSAKLIPKLEEEEQFNVLPLMRVQGQIPSTFKVGKKTNILVLNALVSCSGEDPNRLKLAGTTFAEFLKGRERSTNQYGEPSPTVLIFDQFEELFTSYPGRWADRQAFFAQLGDALEGNPKHGIIGDPLLRVVFCMREDYIAELDPYLPLLPEKLRTRFRLEHLREHKALVAITKPLEKTNRSYVKGVAELLVKNLLKIPNQSITGTQTIGLYVEPVQLQVVCQTIWENLAPNETVITRKHLDKYGDVSQALSNFYERSIRAVAKETNVKEENLRRWFGDTLITLEGTRAPVNRSQDHTGGMPNAAVDKLEGMRLIKGEWKGTNVRWYELAHDRFIEPIRRSNEKWLADQSRGEQIRLRLEAKASKWQPGSSVLEVDELIEARRLIKYGVASKALLALVDTSRASAQRKRIRVFKLIGVGSAVLALLFLTVAMYAWSQRKAARAAEGRAKSRLLANKADVALKVDPELGVLLAKEASDISDTEEAREVIRGGLLMLSNVAGALRGHGAKVTAAELSHDGKYVLTTTEDQQARLWDSGTRKLIKQLSGDGINHSTFSPDGKLIATGHQDGLVRIWEGSTGTFLREFRGHTTSVTQTVFSADGNYLASSSYDNTARVWSVATGELVKELRGHTSRVQMVVFSPDGTHIATEAGDETARIWNLRSDSVISLKGLSGPKSAISFSPDGKLLASEGGPKTDLGATPAGDYPVTVWDAATGKVKFTLRDHSEHITGVTFSPDGASIVTSSADNTARLWGTQGKLISVLGGHTKAVSSALFSADGKFVVTASADNTVRVWDALDGKSVEVLRGHSGAVNSAAFSFGGEFIVTASDDQTARLWLFNRGQIKTSVGVELLQHSGPVNSATFSNDGTQVVTTSEGRAWLSTVGDERRAPLGLLTGDRERVAAAIFSPDGRLMVTTRGKEALLWNADKLLASAYSRNSRIVYDELTTRRGDWARDLLRWELLQRELPKNDRPLQGHTDDVNSVAFSPDGSFIVSASSDQTARVWNAATAKLVAELRGHTNKVNSAAFSPDGKLIVTCGDDATVRIWDAKSFAFLKILGTHTRAVNSAQYSPDGNLVVTASADGVARVWDVKTEQKRFELRKHTNSVNSAAFSPDSRFIITASSDKTARVWNAWTGDIIAQLRGHTGKVLKAVFSPDARFVLTASEDYTARVYPYEAFAPFDEVLALIAQRVARELTPEEKSRFVDEPENR
jgi:WD40 repeat protein